MKKLHALNYIFWKSITSFAYYKELVKMPFSFSWKYFWAFSISLAVFLTVTISIAVVPEINKFSQRFETRAPALFPNDLVIEIKNGEVSTNVPEPLHFPIPYELLTDTPGAVSDQNQMYLVTFDTSASADDYFDSQSLILVTKNQFVAADSEADYRVYSLKDFENMTIDKNFVDKQINTLLPFVRILPALAVFLIFVVFALILPIIRLISLIFLTVIVHLAARLMRVNLTYRKLYQIGLHALTLPVLIQIALIAFNLNPPIPFFNSILFVLYSLVILAELKSASVNKG